MPHRRRIAERLGEIDAPAVQPPLGRRQRDPDVDREREVRRDLGVRGNEDDDGDDRQADANGGSDPRPRSEERGRCIGRHRGSIDLGGGCATVRWFGVHDETRLTRSCDDRRPGAARRRHHRRPAVRGVPVHRRGAVFGDVRVRCVRLLGGQRQRPVRHRRRRARGLQLLAADRPAVRPVRGDPVADLPVDLDRAPHREPRLPWPAGRADGLAARAAAGRPRALPRQRPPVDRGGDRARLPVPVDLGVRPAHQGHAGDRAGVVRRPARMAVAGHRARASPAPSWPFR